MSFIKNIFRRILGKSPSSRSKSENRHDHNPEQNSLSLINESKLDSSLGLIVPQKNDSPAADQNSQPLSLPNVSISEKPKKYQVPGLTSLANARRQLHEVNNNSARGHNESTPKLQSVLLSVEQLPKYENKASKNGRQLPEAQKKTISTRSRKSQQSVDTQTNVPSNNASFSKDQARSKPSAVNALINEEKIARSPFRANENRQPREKPQQEGSSGSPRGGNETSDKIFLRSEAYVKKNRQNLAKALKNIELLDNNPVIPKIQPQSDLNKPKILSNQISRSNSGRNRLQSFVKPKLNMEVMPADYYKRVYDKKESQSPNKQRTESSILNERTYGTIKEEKIPSIYKFQSEGDDIQHRGTLDPRQAAWRRYEIKSREMQQNVSSFENEMERVDRWLVRNSHAMADLVSIRENLLELYLKEDIKMHRRQRSMKNQR